MPESIIHTEHLSRFFGTVKAVDDLSLDVPAGIVFGFLGPNGAGKTTTIPLLLGLLEPTTGQAWILDFDIRTHADAIRARTGALLEFAGLYERMSAEDNIISTCTGASTTCLRPLGGPASKNCSPTWISGNAAAIL